MSNFIPEYSTFQVQAARQRFGIRINEELCTIKTVPLLGLVGPIHPVRVELSDLNPRDVAMPDVAGFFPQADRIGMRRVWPVEQTQQDLARMFRVQREVDTSPIPGSTLGERLAGQNH